MYRSIIPVVILFVLIGTGCNTARYKKLESGLEYKIIKGKGDKEIKSGNFVAIKVTQYYNDSLLSTPFDTIPQIIQMDSMRIPGEYVRIFLQSKEGDSIVTRISTDTIAKHNPLPPFAKEHQFFSTRFKIENIYEKQEDAMKAQAELRSRMMRADSLAMEKSKVADEITIKDYLKKNNINAIRTPEGTYVQIINEGTGKKVDSGMAASVLYKGMLLNGLVFDKSYDSTGKPTQPYTFVVKGMGAIEGWSDGMVYFKEGGEGRLFIPSARAYGTQGSGPDIKPNTPIMFEVKITKVMTSDEYKKERDDQMKKMQEQQKEQMEKAKEQQKQKPEEKK